MCDIYVVLKFHVPKVSHHDEKTDWSRNMLEPDVLHEDIEMRHKV